MPHTVISPFHKHLHIVLTSPKPGFTVSTGSMAYAWSVSGHVATRSTRVSRPEDHQEVKGQGNQEKTPPGGSADLLWSSARLSGQDEQRRGSPGTVSPHTSEKNKTNICFDRMNFILTVSCRLQLDDVWAESGP